MNIFRLAGTFCLSRSLIGSEGRAVLASILDQLSSGVKIGFLPSGVHIDSPPEDEVVQSKNSLSPSRAAQASLLNRKRYISSSTLRDLFWTFTDSAYNTIFKLLFISSSAYTIYLMVNDYKPTHDPNIDTFKVQYLLGASAVLGILFPPRYEFSEILWAFSIWLESVAILPQLFMLQRTGEADTITTHYLFALGIYRALYIPNWIYRYFANGFFEPISVIAGVIQTILYSDFFWIYYTKVLKGKKFTLPV
ncbi:ER lumen protein retaining receptor 2 [Paracoccidioides lutzii Pb01]|uniref:ER lumen protein-retaining receptor n=1 Tax=Paracoccidioides lutzii (strain ATCC MYA-826 / Pb01) TaxID=502779 RepID=C1HDW7_PARBA|nr:ER lumen protein retaining receptor 2 [Paracoccidioides lutzii Pb01]EEH40111.2 ER lumen protein retaining receptor 2 [Paracoccidioides lutzii Pb01]